MQNEDMVKELAESLKSNYGLNNKQAAGFIGNLYYESKGLNPAQKEDKPLIPGSKGGRGYAQFTGKRRKAFEKFAKENDLDPNSHEANQAFINNELSSDDWKPFLEKLKTKNDLPEITKFAQNLYLNPKDKTGSLADRNLHAENILKMLNQAKQDEYQPQDETTMESMFPQDETSMESLFPNKSIYLPDGQELQFPGYMTDEQMRDAIYKNFPEYAEMKPPSDEIPELKTQGQENLGFAGIMKDITEKAQALPGQIGRALTEGHLAHMQDFSGRSARDVAAEIAGAVGGARDIALFPATVASYLGEKQIPGFSRLGQAADYLTGPLRDTGLEKAFLGEEQPGDVSAKMLGMLGAPKVYGKGKSAAKVVKEKAGDKTKALVSALDEKLSKSNKIGDIQGDIDNLKDQLKQTGMSNEAADYAVKQIKEDLGQKYATSTSQGLQSKMLSEKEGMAARAEKANVPYERTENLLPSPEKFSHKDLLKEMTANREQRESSLKKHLQPGEEHNQVVADEVYKDIRKDAASIKKHGYDVVDEQLIGNKIKINVAKNNSQLIKDLRNYFGEGKEADDAIEKALEQIGTKYETKEIPAKEFLDLYKSTSDAARRERNYSYEREIPADKRRQARKNADFLDEKANKLYEVLEDQLPKDILDTLKKADKDWKTKVQAYYGTKLYEAGYKGKKYGKGDMLEDTAGTNPGQQGLREKILKNPDWARRVVANKYASNPKELLNPDLNVLHKKAIEANPRTAQLVKAMERSEKNKQLAEQHYKTREDEIQQMNEAFLQRQKVQADREKAIQENKKAEGKIREYQDGLSRLRKALQNKELTDIQNNKIKEKIKEQEELLKEEQRKVEERKKLISTIVGTAGLVLGAGKAASILSKLL